MKVFCYSAPMGYWPIRRESLQLMSETGVQTCPVCGVKIVKVVGGDRVLFSVGPPGTRATLWTRVCQYTQKAGCINKT
jgi:hypothetical protein